MLVAHEVVVVAIARVVLGLCDFLPRIEFVLRKAGPLCKASITSSNRIAHRLVVRNLEAALNLFNLRSRAATGRNAVHLGKEVRPVLPVVLFGISQFANLKLAFIELELGSLKILRDVVLIDLVHVHRDAVDLYTGIVFLHIMLFLNRRAVAATTNERCGVPVCINTLRTCEAGVGKQQRRGIWDATYGQQTRVVVVGNLYILGRTVSGYQLAIGTHSGIHKLDALGVQVHVRADVVGQLERFAIVKHVSIRVDLDGVRNLLGGVSFHVDNYTVFVFECGVILIKIAIRANFDGILSTKRLFVTSGYLNVIGEVL